MIHYISRTTNKFVILFFCLFSFSLVAQQAQLDMLNLVNTQLQNANDISFYNGKVNLKDNNSIDGRVSINNKRFGEYFTIVRTKDSCVYIPNAKINSVVLNENHKGTTIETKFELLNDGDKLYRQIYHNNTKNVTVYDSSEKPFRNRLGYGVFVKEKDLLTYTYNFWSSGPKKDLINYINKRDKTKFKRRDFKSLQELFDKV